MSAPCCWYVPSKEGCMNDTTTGKKMDCKKCKNFAKKYESPEIIKIVKFRARVGVKVPV